MIYAVCGVALFLLGLVGFILKESLVQKIVSLNIFVSGIFLVFISMTLLESDPDSVATALVLTGLVVTLGVSAFGLMLVRAYFKTKGDL